MVYGCCSPSPMTTDLASLTMGSLIDVALLNDSRKHNHTLLTNPQSSLHGGQNVLRKGPTKHPYKPQTSIRTIRPTVRQTRTQGVRTYDSIATVRGTISHSQSGTPQM